MLISAGRRPPRSASTRLMVKLPGHSMVTLNLQDIYLPLFHCCCFMASPASRPGRALEKLSFRPRVARIVVVLPQFMKQGGTQTCMPGCKCWCMPWGMRKGPMGMWPYCPGAPMWPACMKWPSGPICMLPYCPCCCDCPCPAMPSFEFGLCPRCAGSSGNCTSAQISQSSAQSSETSCIYGHCTKCEEYINTVLCMQRIPGLPQVLWLSSCCTGCHVPVVLLMWSCMGMLSGLCMSDLPCNTNSLLPQQQTICL